MNSFFKSQNLTRFGALAILATATVGCNKGNLPPGVGASPDPLPPPVVVPPVDNTDTKSVPSTKALAWAIKTPKNVYRRGEAIPFTMTIKNGTDKPHTMEFSSGQNFDIEVRRVAGGDPVWNWAHDKMFTMMLQTQTLRPGESRVFTATWEQDDNRRFSVGRGDYSVRARLTVGEGLWSEPITVTLQN